MNNHIRLAFSAALLVGVLSVPASATENADIARQAAQTSPVGNYLAGRIASELRDVDAASIYLRAALKSDPKDPELLDRTFRSVLASGDVEGSFPLAERLGTSDPNNRLARLALAIRAIKSRQFITARTQLGQSLRGPMPDVVAALVTAWAWQGSGDTARALKAADVLSGNDFAELFRDLHAGLIAGVAGKQAEANRRLGTAYNFDQSMFVVVDAYARSLARSGNKDEALKVYRSLAEKMSKNALLNEAIATLEKGGTLQPAVSNPRDGVAEALFTFGQLANRGESAEIGLIYLNLALYLDPSHELSMLTLADLLETTGQYDSAISIYERVPQTSVFREDAGLKIAINLAQSDRTDEAEKRLKSLIAADPKDVDAMMALGNLLHRKKDYKEAAEAFSKAVETTGTPEKANWSLFFARGVAYDGAKDWKRAEADLVESTRLDPEQPVSLNYLGYSWVDRGTKVDEGMELIKKAVELRPNDGDIVDSLGWAYYRTGKLEEATTELERAVELKPQAWEINDHLGDVYWKTDRQLEAKFQWLHALTLEIEPDKRALIERKLTEGLEPIEAEIEAKRAAERAAPPEPAQPAQPIKDDRAQIQPLPDVTGRN